jgi:hypothetical protein
LFGGNIRKTRDKNDFRKMENKDRKKEFSFFYIGSIFKQVLLARTNKKEFFFLIMKNFSS